MTEWSMRKSTVAVGKAVLMRRECNNRGVDADGQPVPWEDVATFDSTAVCAEIVRGLNEAPVAQVSEWAAVAAAMSVQQDTNRREGVPGWRL